MLCHVKVIFISMCSRLGFFFSRVLAGQNGVIPGHGASALERYRMDG